MTRYTHASIPAADRPRNLVRRPHPTAKEQWSIPGVNKSYPPTVGDSELQADGVIIVQDKPAVEHNQYTQRVEWTGIDDLGQWQYTREPLTEEQIAQSLQSAQEDLQRQAYEHQSKFADANGMGQLAYWQATFPRFDPEFQAACMPYAAALETWLKSIWDHYAALKAQLHATRWQPTPNYAALGEPPFTFSALREAIYTQSIAPLPPLP